MKKDDKQNRKKNSKRNEYNLEGIPTSDLKMNYFKKKRQQKRILPAI